MFCRPLNKKELASHGTESCINVTDEKAFWNNDKAAGKPKEFVFDRCFGPESTQQEVYKYAAEPIVASIIEGYNGALLDCAWALQPRMHRADTVSQVPCLPMAKPPVEKPTPWRARTASTLRCRFAPLGHWKSTQRPIERGVVS